MPAIIGKDTIVVEHDGLTIKELAGNVAALGFSNSDDVSIAHVTINEPTAEPWLTIDYDEWLCLLKGKIELNYYSKELESGEQTMTVEIGETCFIKKGERFRPVFPYGNVEYIAVCIPAFKPERCIREEDTETSQVTARLRELHCGIKNTVNNDKQVSCNNEPTDVVNGTHKTSFEAQENDYIYHMCQKKLWDDAVKLGIAYFPPTFEVDGGFTHATALPQRLIQTANHFYSQTVGDWICLQLSMKALHTKGIVTRYEQPKNVGSIATGMDWNDWACPHIFGGIPTTQNDTVLIQTFPMERNELGIFVGIQGLL